MKTINENPFEKQKSTLTILVNAHEMSPYQFGENVHTLRAELDVGDYSLFGLAREVAITCKTLEELAEGFFGHSLFERELCRMQQYRCRAVLVETSLDQLFQKQYKQDDAPEKVLASIAHWQVRYDVPFNFVGCHGAEVCVSIMNAYADARDGEINWPAKLNQPII